MSGGDIALLAMPIGLVAFALLALRFGVDTRDAWREPRGEILAQTPDEPPRATAKIYRLVSGAPLAASTAFRARARATSEG